jgi:hypothetical protein
MQANENQKGKDNPTEKEIELNLIEVLAHIYRSVNWRKVARSKISYDIFEHRLSFSRYEKDIPSLINKLCNTLSLQAPPLPLDRIRFLRDNEAEAMKIVRKMPKLLTLEAANRAKELRDLKKAENAS